MIEIETIVGTVDILRQMLDFIIQNNLFLFIDKKVTNFLSKIKKF